MTYFNRQLETKNNQKTCTRFHTTFGGTFVLPSVTVDQGPARRWTTGPGLVELCGHSRPSRPHTVCTRGETGCGEGGAPRRSTSPTPGPSDDVTSH